MRSRANIWSQISFMKRRINGNMNSYQKEDDFIIQKVADILKDEPEALRYAMEALTYAREK